ncbi:YqaJ viral recombinase family protein [Microbacterium galbinum]|uniref:YqaJ viral recombinase family protein n=1 Tax=Microbacterium galbinum TaxID=2851646 RepID=UPI001FFDC898|nr:YqaJ viral recombinase family protein [Microbacterium galbinum]MCK2031235.1 YqaJ viral recombinase family protein [Microbacterium galbinum]
MTTQTTSYRIVAADSLGSEEGLAARAAGVTASELHAIAQGGRGAHRRILADKLNGSTFRGNAHTRRGHEREDFLIDWANETVAECAGNIALLGHPVLLSILATPDGLGLDFGVEVKSHDHKWGDRDDVPAEHYDQMQGGMAVAGFERWLYVWEVMGEDGTPTLDEPRYRWVWRNEKRIAKLLAEAEKFTAWRAAGAPDADEIPDEVDDALADWADARARKTAAEADEKAAMKIIRPYADEIADDDGAKAAGTRAHFTLAKTSTPELDEAAWADAEPESYAAYLDLRLRVAAAEAAAAVLYSKTKTSTRMNIYPTKDAA